MSLSNDLEETPIEKKNSISSEERSVKTASVFGGDDAVDIDANVQYAGILKKPPFGTKSYGMLTRWTERFCVVKESFLLYYDKSEKKHYESKKMFNIHPKGVIPLANCSIEKWDETGKPGFKITHASFKTGNLVMAAKSPDERDNWIKILQECSKITWNNAQLGAAQIKQLEENTNRINKERTEYIEKLRVEAEARKHEAGQKEEYERLSKKLEEEKAAMTKIADQFKEEKEMTAQELLDAMEAMKKLDEERTNLDTASKELEQNLKKAAEEKARQEDELKKQQEEKERLAATSNQLKSHLDTVEEEAKRLAVEKQQTEQQLLLRLQENKMKAQIYEEEKKKLLRTATEAQLNLEEIAAKKMATELELDRTAGVLEIETKERKRLEKRLRLAEDSLKRLDHALRDSGLKVSIEIEADVTTLKSFFEDAVAEAEHQAKKHLLMEEAVRARKNYEKRAYTKKQNPDFISARQNMNKVEVDPRLLGESQSTVSPSHTPENQMRPEDEPARINGDVLHEEVVEKDAEVAAVEQDADNVVLEAAFGEEAAPVAPAPVDEAAPVEAAPAEPVTAEPVPAEPIPAEPEPAEPAPMEPAPAEPAPAEPTPAEPAPAEPAPAEPASAEPAPAEPAPAEPAPAEPAPAEPAQAESTPAEPSPAEPAPVEPAPAEPAPVEPAPAEPVPAEPAPAEPALVEPAPAEPAPVEPTPAEPTPVEPAPADPAPAEPAPAEPTPAEPAPSEPAPAEPAPAEPTPAEPVPAEAAPAESASTAPAPSSPSADQTAKTDAPLSDSKSVEQGS